MFFFLFDYLFSVCICSLYSAISPMVQNAKAVAHNPTDPNAAAEWRAANNQVQRGWWRSV